MKQHFLLTLMCVIITNTYAQNTNVLPNKLDFAQRTYSQILAIPSPVKGSSCYDTDANCLRIYNGSIWQCLDNTSKSGFSEAIGTCSASTIITTNGGNTGVAPNFVQSASYNSYLYQVGHCREGGQFGYSYSFGNGSINPTAGAVGFISKFDVDGTNLWVRGFYSSGTIRPSNAYIRAVKVDGTGTYIIGDFLQTLSFSTSSSTTGTLTSVGGSDIFVAKLDDSGFVQWIKQFGGTNDDLGIDLTFGESGFVYITGTEYGMNTGYCIPNTGDSDIFIGKIDKINGIIIGQPGLIYEMTNNESLKSINFYDNKILLVGSFRGVINFTSVNSSCGIVAPVSNLVSDNGNEIYIIAYNSTLLPIDSYKIKFGGNDLNDALNPFRAIIDKGFMDGNFTSTLKISGNPTGTFPLGNRIINSGSYILSLNLNKNALPSISEVIEIQGANIIGFGDGYAVGYCSTISTKINSSINFGGKTGKNFLLSTKPNGIFNWVITTDVPDSGDPSYGLATHSTYTVSKLSNSVYSAGYYHGTITFCESTLSQGLRYPGFLWKYKE